MKPVRDPGLKRRTRGSVTLVRAAWARHLASAIGLALERRVLDRIEQSPPGGAETAHEVGVMRSTMAAMAVLHSVSEKKV